MEMSVSKYLVTSGRTVLTMLASKGAIKVPSITADRTSHLDSSFFLVVDRSVAVMRPSVGGMFFGVRLLAPVVLLQPFDGTPHAQYRSQWSKSRPS